jgi:hypothetical protein
MSIERVRALRVQFENENITPPTLSCVPQPRIPPRISTDQLSGK